MQALEDAIRSIKRLGSEGKQGAQDQGEEAGHQEAGKLVSKQSTPCPEPMGLPEVLPIQQTSNKKKLVDELFKTFDSHHKKEATCQSKPSSARRSLHAPQLKTTNSKTKLRGVKQDRSNLNQGSRRLPGTQGFKGKYLSQLSRQREPARLSDLVKQLKSASTGYQRPRPYQRITAVPNARERDAAGAIQPCQVKKKGERFNSAEDKKPLPVAL